MFDSDRDGYLSRHEVETLLHILEEISPGRIQGHEPLRRAIFGSDLNRDDVVSIEEFISCALCIRSLIMVSSDLLHLKNPTSEDVYADNETYP
jgi:Ca2+-binding EF-hand superfamily protein